MKNPPKTVKDAVDLLTKNMPEYFRSKVRSTKEKDLIKFHMDWGMAIRNDFGLWEKDSPLRKDTGKDHPDDASAVIIKAFWKSLNELPIKAIIK